MQFWKAHYKDALHDVDIQIKNTENDYKTNPLSFTLDDITFQGTSVGDFQLADETLYDNSKERFYILKAGGRDEKLKVTFPYWYDLQRYALDIEIPINVVRKKDNQELTGKLYIAFEYVEHDMEKGQCIFVCDNKRVYRDDEIVTDFSLNVDCKIFRSEKKTLYFENALNDICKQMKNDYYLKCCFTCQYSDYSPYGSDDYGTMLCYCRHKEDYLKVNSKDDFFEYLEVKDFDMRQETYLCDEYDLRNKCSGYRGFVEGVFSE